MKNKTKIFFIILLMAFGLLFGMSSNCFATNVPDFSDIVLDGDGYIVYYNTIDQCYFLLIFRNTPSDTTLGFDFSNPEGRWFCLLWKRC